MFLFYSFNLTSSGSFDDPEGVYVTGKHCLEIFSGIMIFFSLGAFLLCTKADTESSYCQWWYSDKEQ